MSIESQVFLLFVLLMFSAFFSASETALSSLFELRIRHLLKTSKGRRAKALAHLLHDPNDFITALVLCNNLVNVGASALATLLFLRVLPPNTPSYLTGLVTTAVMTVLLLVIGEVTPKNLAKNRPEAIGLRVVIPAWYLTRALRPLVRALRSTSSGLVRPFGVDLLVREGPPITRDQFLSLIEVAEERGAITTQFADMMRRILALDQTTADEVMVPRTDIRAIEVDTPIAEAIDFVVRDGHSRYPVYRERLDQVIGILHAKDLLAHVRGGNPPASLASLLRPVIFVPTTKPVSALLREFQQERAHMAVVVDEYGGVAGLVTLEDVLEEIVGEIEDEYDRRRQRTLIRRLSPTEALVDGDAEIKRVNRTLGLSLPEEEAVTIAGLVLETLGDIPNPGTKLRFGTVEITVEEATEREIQTVRVTILPEPSAKESAD
ncbi:MAG: hemolysin family protein [Candidatus Bipolaricaulota bacterium]|nr:hemolysin family protein [Candidatus Bipolaricaulota bacterium]MDW8126904.1 hemolysin family protein [Candidatus Bipolaricaulota bacterium]